MISPDLTRNDKTKLGPSGGPITKDNTSVEYYCTIFAMAESRVEKGLLWVGSDDGLVHVSRDAGKSWRNVTPPKLPAWSMINQIDPSPHEAAHRVRGGHPLQARRRSTLRVRHPRLRQDAGARSPANLPADGFVRVVREDPVRKGLLFCGTETGLYCVARRRRALAAAAGQRVRA